MWKLIYTKETFPHCQYQLLAMGGVSLAAEPPFPGKLSGGQQSWQTNVLVRYHGEP